MTVETLATFTGLVAAVTILVQFTKPAIKKRFSDSVVRIYTWIISIIFTFVFARSGAGVQEALLTIVNSTLIAMASMGAYETIADPKAEKKRL